MRTRRLARLRNARADWLSSPDRSSQTHRDAWKKNEGMSQDDAREKYIQAFKVRRPTARLRLMTQDVLGKSDSDDAKKALAEVRMAKGAARLTRRSSTSPRDSRSAKLCSKRSIQGEVSSVQLRGVLIGLAAARMRQALAG